MPLAAQGQRDEGDGGRGERGGAETEEGWESGQRGDSCRSFHPRDTLAVLRLEG